MVIHIGCMFRIERNILNAKEIWNLPLVWSITHAENDAFNTCTDHHGQWLEACRNDRSMLKAVIMKIRYNVNWCMDSKRAPQDLLPILIGVLPLKLGSIWNLNCFIRCSVHAIRLVSHIHWTGKWSFSVWINICLNKWNECVEWKLIGESTANKRKQ